MLTLQTEYLNFNLINKVDDFHGGRNVMKGVKEATEIEVVVDSGQARIMGPSGHMAKREVKVDNRKSGRK